MQCTAKAKGTGRQCQRAAMIGRNVCYMKTVMSDSRERRLRHLEVIWPNPRCPTCLGRPHRVVMIDRYTDAVISETMAGTGCPACGERIFRDYRIVVERSDAA